MHSRSIGQPDWGALTPLLGSSTEFPLLGLVIGGISAAGGILSMRAPIPRAPAIVLCGALLLGATLFLFAAYRGIRAGGFSRLLRRPMFLRRYMGYIGRPPMSQVPIVALTPRAMATDALPNQRSSAVAGNARAAGPKPRAKRGNPDISNG